jgi:hypothetical protein
MDNINIAVKKVQWLNWIHPTQDRDQWWALETEEKSF